MSKPIVGTPVHYIDKFAGESEPQAAIIVKVHDDTWVALFIISPGGGTRYASHVERGVGWKYIQPPELAAPTQLYDWGGGVQ